MDKFRKLWLENGSDIVKLWEKCNMYGSYCEQKVAENGAPKFEISKLLLQNLIKEGFTVAEISQAHYRPMFSV